MMIRRAVNLVVICLGLIACIYLTKRAVWPDSCVFRQHVQDAYRCAAAMAHGKFASMDKDQLVIWDIASGKSRIVHRFSTKIEKLAFSFDGTRVAAVRPLEKQISILDAATGEELHSFRMENGLIRAVAFNKSGKLFAAGDGDGNINLWDLDAGLLLGSLRVSPDDIWSMAFSPDGQSLASGSGGFHGTVRLWDLASLKERARMMVEGSVTSLAFSPDSGTLASGDTSDTVTLTDIRNGNQHEIPRTHEDDNCDLGVSFSQDGTRLAAWDFNGIVTVSEVSSGQRLETYGWNDGANIANSVEFGPRGEVWAFVSYAANDRADRQIVEVWEFSSRRWQVIAMRMLVVPVWFIWLAFVCRYRLQLVRIRKIASIFSR